MPTLRVTSTGLTELRRALRQFEDKSLRNGLTAIYRDIAKFVRSRAERAAPDDVRRAIGHKANTKGAFVTIRPVPQWALGVFLGAKGRFGWYSARRYQESTARQFRPWVGNQWDPGENSAVPYYIGPAINRSVDEVVERMADGVEDLIRRAFR